MVMRLCNPDRRSMQRYDGDTAGVRNDGSSDDAMIFELAPISLWLQDLSEVKSLPIGGKPASRVCRTSCWRTPSAHERAGRKAACSRSTNER
jgi:hypothetical protein